MKLFPASADSYQDYRNSISIYNAWFIKLRYLAVFFLVLFLMVIHLIFDLNEIQLVVTFSITGIILIYNSIYYNHQKSNNEIDEFNHLKFSLVQIISDLLSLTVLVYMLGTIEAPIILFYIFHMIIGSIILPSTIIYITGICVIALIALLSLLEYSSVISHYGIGGLLANSFYTDLNFIILLLVIFTILLFFTIYLTQKIVLELFSRENHLKHALDELDRVELSKQKSIISVVHDLKSPISAATSFLDLIVEGYTGEITDETKDKIVRANSRIKESIENINNILSISKYKLEKKLEKQSIDVGIFVNRLLNNLKDDILKKKITLIYSDNVPKNTVIKGDPVLLQLAFTIIIKYFIINLDSDNELNIVLSSSYGKIEIIFSAKIKESKENILDFTLDSKKEKNNTSTAAMSSDFVKQIIKSHGGEIIYPAIKNKSINQMSKTEIRIIIPLIN